MRILEIECDEFTRGFPLHYLNWIMVVGTVHLCKTGSTSKFYSVSTNIEVQSQ